MPATIAGAHEEGVDGVVVVGAGVVVVDGVALVGATVVGALDAEVEGTVVVPVAVGPAAGGAEEQAVTTDVTAAARTAHRAMDGRRRLWLGRIVRAYPRTPVVPSGAASATDRYVAAVTTEPTPIVLDVDTGVDDACALLLAALHPALDLRAVTCVGGNAPVDDVVRNTLLVLETAGRTDVPVGRGAERPLLEPPVDARHVHGDDGMGDLGWPPAAMKADPRHAVELLRDVCREAAEQERPVTLVPLAPLTNIALLLRTYPDVVSGISEIVFMGGAANVGNATASAEFNVFHDPEAAAIALDAAADLGIPVTMYGLDVFYEPVVSAELADELVSVGGRGPAELAGSLIRFQNARFDRPASTIGDAGAVCVVIDRAGIRTEPLPLRVELAGTWSRGRTIVDRRDWSGDMAHDPHGEAPVRVDVALEVDGPRYARLWADTVLGRVGER
ncbi:nucleoside hydrolase [Terrabacter sp. Root85]|uniref:nucleoside hydrolase n=1 Tax=Terrabacter sp. Root85 TaxID=1736603 RepID=UPI001F3F532E|nr:nucleoside hydrolase [Terrabacter sp. Root85]